MYSSTIFAPDVKRYNRQLRFPIPNSFFCFLGHEYSSLIDPSWEVIDPTPNVFVLFTQFDNRFFWNRLQSVIVTWSKRMTT